MAAAQEKCSAALSTEIVHRDSEHRIVSATILIHAACGHGLTQGTAPEYPEERNLRLED